MIAQGPQPSQMPYFLAGQASTKPPAAINKHPAKAQSPGQRSNIAASKARAKAMRA
jgi:hypothetical protein